MVGVVLALAASLSWGVGDFIGGVKSRSLPVLSVLLVSMPAGMMLMAVLVAIRGQGPPEATFALYAALAGVAGAAGLAALYRGMALGAISVVAPISATAPLIPVAVGLARGERPGALQFVGIALALIGIGLTSIEAGADGLPSRLAAGAGLGMLAALGFGVFFIAVDAASGDDALWPVLVLRATASVLVVAVVLVVRPRLPHGRADLSMLVAVGAFDVAANGFFAAASSRGLVSIVSVLASLYPLVTIALAYVVLHERIAQTQRAGVVAALAGAVLISVG
ncbi:MAG: EamA family transporter [Gaiellaceae bacterium]